MRKMVLVLATTLFFGGCGGGGGGTGDVGATYKGSTAPATVTVGNAKALSVDAVQGVQDASSVGVLGKSVAAAPATAPQVQSIANVLENCISSVHPKSTVAKTVTATAQGSQNGYAGSFSYAISVNESTGAFTGTISFNQYQEFPDTATLSGNISFNGVFDQTSGAFPSLNITMANLQGVQGSRAITLSGSMSLSTTGATRSLGISVVLVDNANNLTYWLKDFNLTITGNTLTITGTYYDHVQGYVVISTVTPLTVSTYSSRPTSGELLFTGNNGTKARLTYTVSGYILEVDASGNNSFVVIP
jgi:hypothetical protein